MALVLDAQGYGFLLSALGVGAVAVRRINQWLGRRWALSADLVGTAAMVAASVVTTNLWSRPSP